MDFISKVFMQKKMLEINQGKMYNVLPQQYLSPLVSHLSMEKAVIHVLLKLNTKHDFH